MTNISFRAGDIVASYTLVNVNTVLSITKGIFKTGLTGAVITSDCVSACCGVTAFVTPVRTLIIIYKKKRKC